MDEDKTSDRNVSTCQATKIRFRSIDGKGIRRHEWLLFDRVFIRFPGQTRHLNCSSYKRKKRGRADDIHIPNMSKQATPNSKFEN